jgi:hypothetical protein
MKLLQNGFNNIVKTMNKTTNHWDKITSKLDNYVPNYIDKRIKGEL